MITKAKLIVLIVTPMVTGSVSFLASLTILVMIYRSKMKLSTIYRRLICAACIIDLFQSLGNGLSALPMPAGTMWAAVGNDITCGLQGFILVVGTSCGMWYSLSLTIYFLLVVKFDMSEEKIRTYFEPFLHLFPLLYGLIIATVSYVTHNYNPTGTLCWVAARPANCRDNPEVECISKGNPNTLKWIVAGVPVFAVFILNCVLLAIIWWKVYVQTKKSQSYRSSWVLGSHQSSTQQQHGTTRNNSCWTSLCSKISKSPAPAQTSSPLTARLSRPTKASVRRLKEIFNRAMAYVIGYGFTYVFTMVYRFIEAYGSGKIPFAIILLSRFFFPLQGLFNIMIYTYPHVTTCRNKNPEYSWFRAFWEVLKSGGDSDKQMKPRQGRIHKNRKNQSPTVAIRSPLGPLRIPNPSTRCTDPELTFTPTRRNSLVGPSITPTLNLTKSRSKNSPSNKLLSSNNYFPINCENLESGCIVSTALVDYEQSLESDVHSGLPNDKSLEDNDGQQQEQQQNISVMNVQPNISWVNQEQDDYQQSLKSDMDGEIFHNKSSEDNDEEELISVINKIEYNDSILYSRDEI